jgi:nucleotide-binding universal stress UspA family protein
MLKHVLVGVDGLSPSRDAAALAAALTAGTEADVLLVGAYSDPLLPLPPGLRRDEHRWRDAERPLLELRDELLPQARVHVQPDVSPGRALCHAVKRERADLLVLGSSRRRDEGRAGAGRTGRQVLHGAACAVALAARGMHEAPHPLERVVVGVDRSEEAGAALALADELARATGARLTAVAVVDDRLPATVAPAGMAIELVQWDELVAVQRTQADRLLADVTARFDRMAGQARVGDPAEELARVAEGADLLVIGSRQWGPLSRLVIGSTGEELLRDVPCSILLVPRPEAAATGAASGSAT